MTGFAVLDAVACFERVRVPWPRAAIVVWEGMPGPVIVWPRARVPSVGAVRLVISLEPAVRATSAWSLPAGAERVSVVAVADSIVALEGMPSPEIDWPGAKAPLVVWRLVIVLRAGGEVSGGLVFGGGFGEGEAGGVEGGDRRALGDAVA